MAEDMAPAKITSPELGLQGNATGGMYIIYIYVHDCMSVSIYMHYTQVFLAREMCWNEAISFLCTWP